MSKARRIKIIHKNYHVCNKKNNHGTSNKIKLILLKGTSYWYITDLGFLIQNYLKEILVIC